jgi:hypothetical protein
MFAENWIRRSIARIAVVPIVLQKSQEALRLIFR